MGRHEKRKEGECPFCGHEEHDIGRCYHCGIFSDRLPAENQCTSALPAGGEGNDEMDLR
jgi:hypothetical protein